MDHKFSIYQIKESVLETEPMKTFALYDEIVEKFGSVDIDDYDNIYSGEIEEDDVFEALLELLFTVFNTMKPENFKGHSLSAGDIVELDGTMWYCDSFGWKQLETQKQ